MDRVAQCARHAWRLEAGAKVGVLASNCLEYVEVVLGLAQARTPAVLLNTRLGHLELQQICEDCDLEALFVDRQYRDMADTLAAAAGIPVIEFGPDYDAWLTRATSAPWRAPVSGEDIFCVALTGGTTGRSKAVLLSQRSRVKMYLAMRDVFGCYSTDDRNLAVSPLFHGAGFNFCFATLYFGGTVVLLQAFSPEAVIDKLVSERITNISVVPTHLTAIFGLGDRLQAADTSSLRALISNGAPLSRSIKEQGAQLWNSSVLFEAYGGTEAGIISTMAPELLMERPKSVGRIFPGTIVELRREDGAPVAAGEMGELYTRSPYLFSGYVGAGAGVWSEEDWFSAGDLGAFDEDGFLYLVDRKDEKIISGGVNIYPSEVEMAMADHPAVGEVVVFGVIDNYWGEAVHAIVALNPDSQATTEEILAFARNRLGRLKTPKTIEIRGALPKSAAGKVLRRTLRDEYRAQVQNRDRAVDFADTRTAGGSDVD